MSGAMETLSVNKRGRYSFSRIDCAELRQQGAAIQGGISTKEFQPRTALGTRKTEVLGIMSSTRVPG
jgi:hypothetical protein